jgi:hypothetical protein
MGWYATYQALLNGVGPYGTVKESLKGEIDPPRTMDVAVGKIRQELDRGTLVLTAAQKARIIKYRPFFFQDAGGNREEPRT